MSLHKELFFPARRVFSLGHPHKMFRFPLPLSRESRTVGRAKNKQTNKQKQKQTNKQTKTKRR